MSVVFKSAQRVLSPLVCTHVGHKRIVSQGEQKAMNFGVCNTCLENGFLEFLAYVECNKFNKLLVFNMASGFKSHPFLQPIFSSFC
jgi:hypothetical protein